MSKYKLNEVQILEIENILKAGQTAVLRPVSDGVIIYELRKNRRLRDNPKLDGRILHAIECVLLSGANAQVAYRQNTIAVYSERVHRVL